MAFLPALALAAGTGGAGYLGGRLAQKLGDLVGFKKGGSLAPKAMSKALNSATVKKTGTRIVKKKPVGNTKTFSQSIEKGCKTKANSNEETQTKAQKAEKII